MQCVRKAMLEDPGEYSGNREKDKGTHYAGYLLPDFKTSNSSG